MVDCIALYVKRLVAWGAISYKELGVDATWFPGHTSAKIKRENYHGRRSCRHAKINLGKKKSLEKNL